MNRRRRIVFKPFTADVEGEPKSTLPVRLGTEIFTEAGIGPRVKFTFGGSPAIYVVDRETLETCTEPGEPRALRART